MARSQRRSAGCLHGRFKPKKMGKGMSAHHPKLGYRPKPKPKKQPEDTGNKGSGNKGTGNEAKGDQGTGDQGSES
ncbi:MAG: hypothetical protein ACYTGW_06695 [Planctomycetota bacterium]|jgi:hypothetical protein